MEMPRDQRGFMYMDKVLNDDRLGRVLVARLQLVLPQYAIAGQIDVEQSEPGTDVDVVGGNPRKPQKSIRATVAPAPDKKDNRLANLKALP
jgi:vanillate/3-O-methylgallate O-demethylase